MSRKLVSTEIDNLVIIGFDMKHTLLLTLLILLATPAAQGQTISPDRSFAECRAAAPPSEQDLQVWLTGSVYTRPTELYIEKEYSQASAEFRKVWGDLRSRLVAAFRTKECDYDKINDVLYSSVFKKPPEAVAFAEDFSMPVPVALTAARAACLAGDIEFALNVLRPGADSGDPAALAVTVVIESIDNPESAMARVTDRLASEHTGIALAGCLASIRAEKKKESWCAATDAVVDERRCLAIIDLIEQTGYRTGNLPEAPADHKAMTKN